VELEFNKIIIGYFCRESIPKPKLIVKIKINETEIIKNSFSI
jgi:hypothetical protein